MEFLKRMLRRRAQLEIVIVAAAVLAFPAGAGERQLESGPAPRSAREIKTPIQRMTPKPSAERPPLIPWLSKPLEKLPPSLRTAGSKPATEPTTCEMTEPAGS